MREIKLKAWDKTNHCMREVLEISFLQSGEPNYIWVFAKPHPLCLPKGQYDLMQYIGRKDKNGNEIYEGAILKAQQWQGGKLIWLKGVVTYDAQCCRYAVGNTAISGTIEQGRVIIGNIYETPNLLKDRTDADRFI